MSKNCYQLNKNIKFNKIIIDFESLNGLDITPKNSGRYGMNVSKLDVIDKTFIEKILKKKIKRKLELYLKFIVEYMDDGNDDGTSLNQILNDLKRYKQILKYKYLKYLGEKQTETLLKKLDLIDRELNIKLFIVNEKEKTFDYEEELTNSRRR